MSSRFVSLGVALVLVAAMAVGCGSDRSLAGSLSPRLDASRTAAPPPPLTTVTVAGAPLTLWPFTGSDFTGTPSDPINLVFAGRADPRALRAALFALDGDRTAFGFPNAAPFNCTWHDAIGDVQTAYGGTAGWTGSVIQLACGPYGPLRFHLRLFPVGKVTLGGAHFELQIPGTADHQVLSWELAEQLVVADFVRSGILDPSNPVSSTGPLNPAGGFREILPVLYNGLPVELRAAIGGPLGDVSAPVPIGTDGAATVLNVATPPRFKPGHASQHLVVNYGQVIPKPFCAAGTDEYVYVEGPVTLDAWDEVSAAGIYSSTFHADGVLRVTPVDPTTGAAIGDTYTAHVKEEHAATYSENVTAASMRKQQSEVPPSGPDRGMLQVELRVGPGGLAYSRDVTRCTP